MKHFLMNLLLSFIWVALTGSMYYSNFLFGFLLGFFTARSAVALSGRYLVVRQLKLFLVSALAFFNLTVLAGCREGYHSGFPLDIMCLEEDPFGTAHRLAV